MKYFKLFLMILGIFSSNVSAVTGRSPTGVNVNSNGSSTVFITFQNLEPNEVPVDAFWCGEVSNTGVVVGSNPCVPGTLFGHLPKQLDLSRITGTANTQTGGDRKYNSSIAKNGKPLAPRNLTDVMSIPIPVIRRAYQEAQKGKSSEFFYVRQFNNNGINTYVTVTCRMGGGGARTPLSLTRVDLNFKNNNSRQPIIFVKQFERLEPLSAKVSYNGSGLLKGRWELVLPGDIEPSSFDLLSEASLPAEQRALQKRYRLLSRFQKFLPPNGKVIIEGPNVKYLPSAEKGLYRILFRIEASNDKEGNSDTLAGIVNTGGVAGFPMPTLRYFVGDSDDYKQNKSYPPVNLLLPLNNKKLTADQLVFSWIDLQDDTDIATYKIEFYHDDNARSLIASAFIKVGISQYRPIGSTVNKLTSSFLWRVIALDKRGNILSTSPVRQLTPL